MSYNPQPPLEPRPGTTKPPGPNWGRAAVAVALGFEPRVAVTPHSISSAAPSAARTRYLTRILYYTNPPTTQIDHPRWEQSHTPKPRVRSPTRTSRYAIASNSPRPPRPPRTSGSPGKAWQCSATLRQQLRPHPGASEQHSTLAHHTTGPHATLEEATARLPRTRTSAPTPRPDSEGLP